MPVVIDGSNGITTPDVESTGQIIGAAFTGTTAAFSGNVTANGVATELRPLVLGTSQASTSGTAIDFTGIPSWTKRVTVMFNGVSTTGTSGFMVQLGDSGGVENSGYSGGALVQSNIFHVVAAGIAVTGDASYFTAATLVSGAVSFSQFSGSTWVASGNTFSSNNSWAWAIGGIKPLSAALDRIRVTTVNGTDTFDAGTINIMYE